VAETAVLLHEIELDSGADQRGANPWKQSIFVYGTDLKKYSVCHVAT
jgi:hypothetical protein